MSSHPARVLPMVGILSLTITCHGDPEPPAPPRLATALAERQMAGTTVRGQLPVGWSVDSLDRLVAIEEVGGAAIAPAAPVRIATMSIELSRLPRTGAPVAEDLAPQRDRALVVFGGARPEVVRDLEERRLGVWTLVTRIEEPMFAGRWSYLASVFHVPAEGDAIFRCAAAARLDRAQYWQALVDICADLEL